MNFKLYIFLLCFLSMVYISCNNNNTATENNTVVEEKARPQEFKQQKVFDIMELANKTPNEVKKVLGEPSKLIKNPGDCATLGYCELEAHYKNDSITILYKLDKAMWFEFDHLDTVKWYNKLDLIGLTYRKPDTLGDGIEHYKDFPGLKLVACIPSKFNYGYTDYIIVEAKD